MTARAFDVIVIGAGPAGEVLAARLAKKGHEVAVAECDLVGGECAYYACMPSKALLRPAQALAEARRVPGAAQAAPGDLDVQAVLRRRDEVVHGLDDSGQLEWLDRNRVTLLRGRARLDGERAVQVGDQRVEARQAVVIATGSEPAPPPIPGLEEAGPWTNREVTTADRLPGRLIVLGGGPVGVEMADAYASLGASVTLIETMDRILSGEEPFVSEQLTDALHERGVALHLDARVERAERAADGDVRVVLEQGTTLTADELLVATGRRARVRELGLETVAVEFDRFVEVDDRLQVPGVPWLYVIGDANGRSLLTHVGKWQAHVLSEILDGDPQITAASELPPPRVVFTEPQVAAVGLTHAAARERGLDAHAYDFDTSATAGASFHGRNAAGTSRIVVDESDGVLVGATFVGPDVAEWLHAATIAVVARVPVQTLWTAIPAFPTRSEIWLKLLERREAQIRAGGVGDRGASQG